MTSTTSSDRSIQDKRPTRHRSDPHFPQNPTINRRNENPTSAQSSGRFRTGSGPPNQNSKETWSGPPNLYLSFLARIEPNWPRRGQMSWAHLHNDNDCWIVYFMHRSWKRTAKKNNFYVFLIIELLLSLNTTIRRYT